MLLRLGWSHAQASEGRVRMISADRFIASSVEHDEWIAARKTGVTATQVAKAGTPAGFKSEVAKIAAPVTIADNAYMKFGRDNERWLALALKSEFGVLPNDWLIAGETRWHLATPDGLSPDHATICEIKTTGKDWGSWAKVPADYKRQVHWQMHVTGAERAVFAWMLRVESNGAFVPGWFEPKFVVVERDDNEIEKLVTVAEMLHEIMEEQNV